MGLRNVIALAVDSAFKAVGDIPQAAVYRRSTSTYVPSTGVNTIVNVDYNVTGIFLKFNEIELSRMANTNLTDIKMLIKDSSLTITPNVQTDKVVYLSKTWAIINYVVDPAGATMTFQLRAP